MKPSIPKGTRDFGPTVMNRRNFIFNTIKTVFERYGYQPIETPSLENLSTLMGKYGEEGDKLLFKVLNSGDFLKKTDEKQIAEKNLNRIATQICDRGLRYDLTVPFARFVVQHRNEITFPFKRFQIQPVWRADRPQKGRYREFYQCDVDVVGSNSLINEAELVQIVDEVFSALKIRVVVKINNRKILAGISEIIGEADRLIDITVAIDKLEKIGLEKVCDELLQKGISQEKIELLKPVLLLEGDTLEKLEKLKTILAKSEIGLQGVTEMEKVFSYISAMGIKVSCELDLTLARGLNYYTGAIFEVKALDAKIGSITGGGRYDDLTSIFGLPNVSGVGISFGADRIYDVMEQLDLFPPKSLETTRVLFINFGEKEALYCLPFLKKLRDSGINVELFPESVKMKKQMNYANQRVIPFVVMVGDTEIEENKFSLKNMETGDQSRISFDEFWNLLRIYGSVQKKEY